MLVLKGGNLCISVLFWYVLFYNLFFATLSRVGSNVTDDIYIDMCVRVCALVTVRNQLFQVKDELHAAHVGT